MVRGQKSSTDKVLWLHVSQQLHQGKIFTFESNWEKLLCKFVQADSLEGEKEARLKGVEKGDWNYGEAGGEGECRKDLRIIPGV